MRMLCVVCIVVGAPLLFPAAVGLIRRRRSALLVMLLSGLAGVSTLLCLGARGAVSPRCGSMPRRTALKTDVAVVRGVVSASIYMARLKVSALPLTARSAACKHTPPRDTLALCSAEPAWLTSFHYLSPWRDAASQSASSIDLLMLAIPANTEPAVRPSALWHKGLSRAGWASSAHRSRRTAAPWLGACACYTPAVQPKTAHTAAVTCLTTHASQHAHLCRSRSDAR